jgi:hypothetical protein
MRILKGSEYGFEWTGYGFGRTRSPAVEAR